MADIFDRIADALTLILSGAATTDPAVVAHLVSIDAHLENDDDHNHAVDAHLATLDANTTEEAAQIGVIEAGLQKIADVVAPAPLPESPATTSAASPITSDAALQSSPAPDVSA